MSEKKEYSIRIVCDDFETPIDWPVIEFEVPVAFLDRVSEIENLLRWILAKYGDKLQKFRIFQVLLEWYETLGAIVTK